MREDERKWKKTKRFLEQTSAKRKNKRSFLKNRSIKRSKNKGVKTSDSLLLDDDSFSFFFPFGAAVKHSKYNRLTTGISTDLQAWITK